MKSTRPWMLWVSSLAFAATACGSTTEEGVDPYGCQPNTASSCACTDGTTATQTCAADGLSYSACQCAPGVPPVTTNDPSVVPPPGSPTVAPTAAPTTAPTTAPTAAPTTAPTTAPTSAPTTAPTTAPTAPPVTPPETSTIDANGNLIPPAPGDGLQLATTEFTLRPGEEVFRCYHTEVPLDGEIKVSKFESLMSAGSHHFILYKAEGDTTPVGTLTNSGCTSGFGGDTWLYTSGAPHEKLAMPPNVAMIMEPRQRIIFDMHYLNTTTEDIHAKVTLNINLAKGENVIKAGSLVSFHAGIAIPPNGEQTVQGDCTPGPGANFFLMSSHTHKRGVLTTVSRKLANGQVGEEFVHTDDWEHPDALYRPDAPFVTFEPGEKLHFSCAFQNDRSNTVGVGVSAEEDEMCMAITYFFPASAGGSCGIGGITF